MGGGVRRVGLFRRAFDAVDGLDQAPGMALVVVAEQ
jgi:hypothetical protein